MTRPARATSRSRWLTLVLLVVTAAPLLRAQEPVSQPVAADTSVTRAESEHWTVDVLSPPGGAVLEVGGMDWMADGSLVLSTRRGQVWRVHNALADDPAEANFTLLAEGLHEGLGLNVLTVPDGNGGTREALFVLQRGELTELRDDDGDGRYETWITVSDAWGLSGNYHEFAFGLPDDGAGNLYLSLNLGFLDPEWWLGRSVVPWRGWVLRVSAATGETTPVASGFRSPCGIGFDAHGRLLVTDNQGDWMASTPVFVVEPGNFHGHPASLDWTDELREHGLHASLEQPTDTPRTPPAVWVPYGWSRSAGNLVPLPADGSFGPFGDQLVMAELTNGHLMRVQLQQVGDVMQGAVIPLRQRIGSAARVLFGADGTLFAGFTNRGWGGLAPDSGLARVRYTGVAPFEMDRVSLVPGGFEISFTEALAPGLELAPEDVAVVQYHYDYWWEYGSPERELTDVAVETVSLSPDRRTLQLSVPGLAAARVARVTLSGLAGQSGRPLLHDTFAYTVNQLADGSVTTELVARAVPPPPPRQSGKEGWLRLSYGDALDAWTSTGWALVEADLHPNDRSTFLVTPGVNALVNVGMGPASDYVSRWNFGSGTYHLEFLLPEGGRSSVWIAGRYGIELTDDTFGLPDGSHGTGSLLPAFDGSTPAAPPARPAYSGAGHWHVLEVDFEAPRFDDTGHKTDSARFAQVRLDGIPIHEDVVLVGPSIHGRGDEAPAGPLIIGGQTGPVALRTLEFRPARVARDGAGWVDLLGGDTLAGWSAVPAGALSGALSGADADNDAGWQLEDGELIGEGERSWLLSPGGNYRNVSVHASVRINEGGDAGLLLRARQDGERVLGYEAQINSSFSEPCKNGGLLGLAPVSVQLIPAGTWFDLDVSVRDEADGTRITVAINGVTTVDFLDTKRLHEAGHIALQQHHQGGRLRVRELKLKSL